MVRQPSVKIIARNQNIIDEIKFIKQAHPFWGHLRVWAYLTYHLHHKINGPLNIQVQHFADSKLLQKRPLAVF